MHRLLVAFAAGSFALLSAQEPSGAEVRPAAPALSAKERRALRVQRAADALVGLVEKHSGLKFKKPPRVRAATHAEWRQAVKDAFELTNTAKVVQMSIQTLGLYLPEKGGVLLSPLVVGPLLRELDDDAPRHLRLALQNQKATIVHELVHALQDQHFGLPTRLAAAEGDDEVLRLKYVIEGHAVLVEELVAERELGLEDFVQKSAYVGFGGDPCYLTGRRYFLHLLRTGGMPAVHAALKSPPSFDELIERAGEKLPPERPDAGASRESKPGGGPPRGGGQPRAGGGAPRQRRS